MDDRQAEQLIVALDEIRKAIDGLTDEISEAAAALGAFGDATKNLAEPGDEENSQ